MVPLAITARPDPVETQHFVQRVEQRAQVGVDFGADIAGQKPEFFAGFDRRAHQQYAVNLVFGKRLNRACHRQIGLASAGRADGKIDVVAGNVAQVIPLPRVLAANQVLSKLDHDLFALRRVGGFIRAGTCQLQVDVAAGDRPGPVPGHFK